MTSINNNIDENTICHHDQIFQNRGLAGVGKEVASRAKRITFIFLQVISCLTIVFIPLAFVLIHRHYKQLGRETLLADNIAALRLFQGIHIDTEEKKQQAIHNRILRDDASWNTYHYNRSVQQALKELKKADEEESPAPGAAQSDQESPAPEAASSSASRSTASPESPTETPKAQAKTRKPAARRRKAKNVEDPNLRSEYIRKYGLLNGMLCYNREMQRKNNSQRRAASFPAASVSRPVAQHSDNSINVENGRITYLGNTYDQPGTYDTGDGTLKLYENGGFTFTGNDGRFMYNLVG